MALATADTSFLFSLFGNDSHTAATQAWTRQARIPISVTVLNRYEFGNAVRFAAFKKVISQAEARATLEAFETDLKSGYLQLVQPDFAAVIAEAARLSELYTLSGGHRCNGTAAKGDDLSVLRRQSTKTRKHGTTHGWSLGESSIET